MTKISAVVQTCTADLAASKVFYQKLGYELLSDSAPTLFTDHKMILEINPQRHARVALKLYQEDWSKVLENLKGNTAILEIEGGHLISDPNGVKIFLMHGELKGDYKLAGESIAIPGNFMGLSIEAVDVQKSIDFWKRLGYKKTMGGIEQGWITFDNGSSIGVSIMKSMICPHLFFNPGLTFFNGGKNLPIIQKIRDAGIPITEEITHFNKEGIVDNVIICDPGGLGFFIFND